MSIDREPEVVDAEVGRPEHRWPMALAVVLAILLHHAALPPDFKINPSWLYPAVAGLLLVVLFVGDPGVIDKESRPLRLATNVLIALIALSNLLAAVRLVDESLNGTAFDSDPTKLLKIGGSIWAINVVAFALWFWDVDGGGSAARARRGSWADPAFIFPEMEIEKYVAAGWYARFVDYLVLSFYTATSFSPSDASVVKRWAKLIMVLESASSLALVAIVLAKAVNALG